MLGGALRDLALHEQPFPGGFLVLRGVAFPQRPPIVHLPRDLPQPRDNGSGSSFGHADSSKRPVVI
jgi:hypothetical protein